jgi:hypothetical protein
LDRVVLRVGATVATGGIYLAVAVRPSSRRVPNRSPHAVARSMLTALKAEGG